MPPVPRRRSRDSRLHAVLAVLALTLGGAATVMVTPSAAADGAAATDAARADRPAVADAVELGRVPTTPLWIEAAGPPRGGAPPQAAVLGDDGAAWWVGPAGPLRLASGLLGEQMTRCGGALVAVGGQGALVRFQAAPDLPPLPSAGPAASMLHRPACLDGLEGLAGAERLPEGGLIGIDSGGDVILLSAQLMVLSRSDGARALPDAEPVAVELPAEGTWAVALLADPTQRYRNGLLGDEVEAGSVLLLALPGLEELARWRATAPEVVEDRRVTPWRDDDTSGLHLVVSGEGQGARLVTLAYVGGDLAVVAAGAPLARESGWLHVLGAAGRTVYLLHDPHLPGPLVRATVPTDDAARQPRSHEQVEHRIALASHVLGERNLDRAAHLPGRVDGVDVLALPRLDLRGVVWLLCDEGGCLEAAVTSLPATLATNLAPVVEAGVPLGLLAADVAGVVWWLPVPEGLGR